MLPISTAKLPDFEISGQTLRAELLRVNAAGNVENRTPISSALKAGLPESLHTVLAEPAVNAALETVAVDVWDILEEGRGGILLRLNVFRAIDGRNFSPEALLATIVGFGLEPLDALAESFRAVPRLEPGEDFQDVSSYAWMFRAVRRLSLVIIPSVLARELENDALTEASRRTVLGGVSTTVLEASLEQVRNAERWHRLHREMANRVRDAADAQRMEHLEAQFERAERDFNRAYLDFKTTQKEIADTAKRSAFFKKLETGFEIAKPHLRDFIFPKAEVEKIPMSQAGIDDFNALKADAWQSIRDNSRTECAALAGELKVLDFRLDACWHAVGVTPGEDYRPDTGEFS
jgi:hypothetical protein